jgi:hypothetical protein
MDDLERLLTDSLRREDPPAGFEQRVLAATRRSAFSWRPLAAIAAAVSLVAGAGWEYDRARRERYAGQEAKAKLELALRVTSAQLQKVQHTLDSLNEGN